MHDTVVTALRETRIAHFTCHGLADLHNPTASRLLLEDHEQKPLTVARIAGTVLPHAELAYLSACSTTDTTADYTDEAVTLATAFQLAGYRAVVGAPWPVNDHAASTIAQDFCTYLTANGSTEPDTAAAAAALHHALRKHRARRLHLPTQWTAYVHTGA